MGITKNYTILHDLPMFFDPIQLNKGIRQLKFFPNIPSRFEIVPRYGDNSDIRWFEATPCYILHISNSYEIGDEVIMMAVFRHNQLDRMLENKVETYITKLERIWINIKPKHICTDGALT